MNALNKLKSFFEKDVSIIWIDFYNTLKERYFLINREMDYQVFSFTNNEALKKELITNPKLKKIVKRAEDLHFLVKSSNVKTLFKELAKKGFFN